LDKQLAQLERLFWNTARGMLDRDAVMRAFRSQGALDAIARMAIYRDMYFARQVGAMREDFPLLRDMLGAGTFDELVYAYLRAHPSESPALEGLARRFAGFLSEHAISSDACELAALEWLACRALVSAPDSLAEFASIAPEAWPGARLRLSRSLSVCEAGSEARRRFLGARASEAARAFVAVFRQGFRVRSVELGPDEASALERVQAGQTFAEVCGSFASAERAAQVVRNWFARQWISEIEGGTA
jgi:hypothetical protein